VNMQPGPDGRVEYVASHKQLKVLTLKLYSLGVGAAPNGSAARLIYDGHNPGRSIFHKGAVADDCDKQLLPPSLLARIIHERFVGLRFARRKTDEYAEEVAKSPHHRLQRPKIEFPLFINEIRLRE
jgi:hypothetical protein